VSAIVNTTGTKKIESRRRQNRDANIEGHKDCQLEPAIWLTNVRGAAFRELERRSDVGSQKHHHHCITLAKVRLTAAQQIVRVQRD
jgi:hypothetical protein